MACRALFVHRAQNDSTKRYVKKVFQNAMKSKNKREIKEMFGKINVFRLVLNMIE